MGEFFRIVVLFCGAMFTFTVIRLLIKKKINEKVSLLWLIGSIIVFIISVVPSLLDKISYLIGVDYPPSLLFMAGILIILFICLMHSVQISILNNQIKELTQQIIIQEYTYKDTKNDILE